MKNLLKNYLYDNTFKMVVTYAKLTEPYKNHLHNDFYELVFMNEGSGVQVINNEEQHLSVGDIFVIPPGMSHEFVSVDNLGVYNILFNKSFFNNFRNELQNSTIYHILFQEYGQKQLITPTLLKLPYSQLIDFAKLSSEIIDELNAKQTGFQLACISNFQKLLLIITRHAQIKTDKKFINVNLNIMNKLLAEIDENFAKHWTVQDMAKLTGMSVDSFRMLFKKITGFSPMNYLIRIRLDKSIVLLQDSTYSISEIGYMVGFSDSNYYTRQFNKYFGKSPKFFRIK